MALPHDRMNGLAVVAEAEGDHLGKAQNACLGSGLHVDPGVLSSSSLEREWEKEKEPERLWAVRALNVGIPAPGGGTELTSPDGRRYERCIRPRRSRSR
jgi:hypothetical protein